ncbi:hypothetical protein HanRHA438_Chr11g0501841 [Helianthus annuus]|uniref:Auxin response factor n=1 Tax=Helianthus annuus TaxID=4232 RepID=A0A9K3HPA3_HELAN|nr:hypothetical protein HanXRQr2_Chr11g0489091 [Helianthus annuus]KAJ0689252.1 putative auxin response factor [Helianthus annuus]KAJ0870559.1 hypothetical protein HanRHA438_Chr11g0501841 [Helianthus annuus]KAJ0875027.1 hypothetical protein HanPSC8_Chr11g0471371 [Helianthus annuus]
MANTAQSELLNDRLWNAYARPQAYVPLEGERIYYFPQGHIEQLEGSMHYGFDQQLSTFCLPEKILCKVMNVELRDEPSTGEMHANTLHSNSIEGRPSQLKLCYTWWWFRTLK